MFNQTTNSTTSETQNDTSSDAVSAVDLDALELSSLDDAEVTSESQGDDAKYKLLQDQFTRLAADFENFRKRVREEQSSLARYGAQKTVMELLPVLDNLERATASLSETSDPKVLFQSFGLVYKQLTDGLEGLGVKKIQAIGQEFDPQYHEAVNQMPSETYPENVVAHEAQSGYLLHDKVLRPAMVVVSTGGGHASGANAAEDPSKEDGRVNPFLK